MKLHEVLQKTQSKSGQNKIRRLPPSIAVKDRPYSLEVEKTDSQSESKLGANWEQSESKLGAKWEQSESKLGANREQSESKLGANREQSESKLGANREQSESKLGAKPRAEKAVFFPLSKITGQQKTLLVFIYHECKKARMENTEALTLEHISSCTGIGKIVVKNALQRLENKNCITRKEYKNGRGGWTKYALRNDLFHDMLLLEKDSQLDNKVGAKPRANPPPSSSISSLVVTREDFKVSLPEGWEDVFGESLSKIGFVREHLHQLCKNENLTPQIVQDSIDAFSFDLEENGKAEKIKGSPLAYFMGILRKGIPYTPPENYESPETLAFRRYVENRERQKAAREDLEKRNFELDLDDWIEKQTEEELNKAIEEPRYRDKDSPFRRGALSLYFKKNVWTPPRLKENNPSEE